jgi:hypothetical protein
MHNTGYTQLLGSYSSENSCEIFDVLGIFGKTRLRHATAHSRKPLAVIVRQNLKFHKKT